MRVVSREGALRFTLEQVGREAGITAPAVLQRFGTKRKLLLALSERGRREPGDAFARARAQHASRVDALVHGLTERMTGIGTPKEIARSLEYLGLDMADPGFHEHALAFFDALRGEVEALLREAAEKGELEKTVDVPAVARACEVAFNGSVITWGVRHGPEASLAEAVRHDLVATLAPFRTPRRTGRAAPSPRARHPSSGGGRASRGT